MGHASLGRPAAIRVSDDFLPFSKSASCDLSEIMAERVSDDFLQQLADCYTWAYIAADPTTAEWRNKMSLKSGDEPVCHTHYVGGKADDKGKSAFNQKEATPAYFAWIRAKLRKFEEVNGLRIN